MDSPDGQMSSSGRGTPSQVTRERLLRAAAELIAEVGWGRVTTRAVAARAGLPHGSVSYHFRGKQDLLTEAALRTFEQAFPVVEIDVLERLTDFLALFEAWVGGGADVDPVVAGVAMEAMLEAERNPLLRERLADTMRAYRAALVRLASREGSGAPLPGGATAAGLATLLAAVGDGLFLHARIDPELDGTTALAALRALLRD